MKKLLLTFILSFAFSPLVFAGPTEQEICAGNGIDYQEATAFVDNVQNLLKSNDKTKLSEMITYPLRVNKSGKHGKIMSVYIKSKEEFIKKYSSLFSKKMKEDISKKDIFCQSDGASSGQGSIWFNKVPNDGMKIFSINVT